nr:polyamine ABC transporter substrate-binding protein [uncultured Gellertiella sp.]
MITMTRRTALTLIGATALSAPFVRRARADDKALNVYNWADYIGETTIQDFQQETGITVSYDTYSSAEEMQAKMLAGKSGYDVAVHAGLSLPTFIQAGVYEKLDRTKLPSWSNLDPDVLRIVSSWDPNNEYGIPYMWGSVGFTYNLDMVKQRLPDADLESMDTIFKPENAAKLNDCGISVLDSPTDILLMVLKYVGVDPDNATEADYEKAAQVFKPIRKYIRTFDNTNYLNAIPNKELCAINNWSGDYSTASNRAKDAGIDIKLGYFVPKTGAPAWADCMCIPTDAPNKESAYKFLEYMLQPEVVASCSNLTNYANGNLASKAFIKPEILANPAVYPDAAVMKRLWAPAPFTPEQDRAITRVWSDVKAAS